ncbi:MAG: HAMP domain-containing sensor histidine kinase [Nocardioidaceae bacterium]
MRRRIVTVALAAVALAVTVFGIPLAILVQRMVLSDEQGELERLALRAAVDVGPTYASGDPIELPSTEAAVQLAVYDTAGARITGRGPVQLDQPLEDALNGVPVDSRNGLLAAAVPVNSGEQVIAVVRASSPSSVVQHRVWWLWAGMAGIATIAAASAFLLARRLSTVLVRPLIELEQVSTELGEGNLGARAGPSGVAEIDHAGAALNRTADRLSALIARQRSFTADASHQLRTPLTRLRLELEKGLEGDPDDLRLAVQEALASADVLGQTVDDVLALARGDGGGGSFSVEALLDGVREAWHGTLAAQDRPLRLRGDPGVMVVASLPAARQIVQTLVDNAYRHGSGVVEIQARDVGGAVAIDVLDEGAADGSGAVRVEVTHTQRPREGRGLALARSLAEAEGGRLTTGIQDGLTRVSVYLPTLPEDTPERDRGARAG